MIANTQITIIICGEKKDSEGKIIPSPGVIEEAELSRKQGNLIIPIAVTGGAAYIIWKDMTKIKNKGYKLQEFNALNQTWKKYEEILYTVENILSHYIS